VRRIEAVTGIGATHLLQELEQNISSICNELLVDLQPIDKDQNNLDLIRDLQSQLNLLAKELNVSQDQILKRILDMKERITSLENALGSKPEIKPSCSNLIDAVKELKSLSKSLEDESKKKDREGISASVADLKEGSIDAAGYKLITKSFENTDSNSLRELADQLRNNEVNTIVTLTSVSGDKIPLIVACSKEVEIDAREIMQHLVNQLGGSGGGRADFAQGGADTSEDLEIALDSVADLVVSLTNQ
jgi:alanyl-tRNA synthetase